MCGLCESICKKEVKFVEFIHKKRIEAVNKGVAPLNVHKRVLKFEKNASSRYLTGYFFSENSDKIFFPGCAFSGNSPEFVIKVYERLTQIFNEKIGIMVDCCFKISHDLGLMENFYKKLKEKINLFKDNGIKEIITVCASCTEVFRKYTELTVTPLYIYFQDEKVNRNFNKLSVHDPCSLRNDEIIQEVVRKIIINSGIEINKMKHERRNTFCCGEGGAAGFVDRKYSRNWKNRRLSEVENDVVVYCYGCKYFLKNRNHNVYHILDLLFENNENPGKISYWINRWKLKRRILNMGA